MFHIIKLWTYQYGDFAEGQPNRDKYRFKVYSTKRETATSFQYKS